MSSDEGMETFWTSILFGFHCVNLVQPFNVEWGDGDYFINFDARLARQDFVYNLEAFQYGAWFELWSFGAVDVHIC